MANLRMDNVTVEKGGAMKKVSQLKLNLRQILTAFGPLMCSVISGLVTGYSAVLLPQLRVTSEQNSTNSSDITISTIEEESWIAASAVLPMAPGCLLTGILMDKFGRRITCLWTCPIYLTGWLILGLCSNITHMLIGRVFCGLCVGLVGPLASVYIGETTAPSLRGVLLGSICVALSAGILFAHLLGTWLHWRLTAYICGVFPIISGIMCYFGEESPTWLLAKGRINKARESWIKLRGEDSIDEFVSLENSQMEEQTARKNRRSKGYDWGMYLSPQFLKPLVVLSLFFLTCQFSGVNVVTFYSVEMLQEVSGPGNGYLGCLLMDVVRLLVSAAVCVLIKKWARRTLAMFSGVGTALTLLVLSICLYFEIGKPWASALLLIVYTVTINLGLMPLPWMLCGELFPRKYRGLGSGLTSAFTFMCFFTVVKSGPLMFEKLQSYGTFCIYGVVALAGSVFLYLTLPETKDKSLEEIERLFDKKSSDTGVKHETSYAEMVSLKTENLK